MKTTLDSLKASLEQRLSAQGNTRVGQEVHNLSGQFHARTIWKTLIRTVPDLCAMAGCWLIAWRVAGYFVPIDKCAERALLGGFGERCWDSRALYVFFALAGCALFLCSFVGTRLKKHRPFQHSALLSASMLLVILYLAHAGDWPFAATAIVALSAFLLMFSGYRLGLLHIVR